MKNTAPVIIFTIFALSLTAQSEPAGLRRFAIFAGSNNGGAERIRLEYAETDARAMYNVLSEIGGLSSADTIVLADPDPLELQKAFEEMKVLIEREKSGARRTEFFFYYSGHSDESGILPGGNLYGYPDLRNEIDSMNTDVKIAVLDSCSSGSFTRLKGGVKKAPFLVDESVDTTGHAFLTSSSENEAAQESDSIEGSYFTHYLISALRGAGDSTLDGTVTLNEAYSFAADETLARTTTSIAGAQHPSYSINLTGSGDLVLTDLREVVSTLTIDKEIDGRIFFRDSSDRLVLEFRKRAGIPVSLSLPGGKYKVELEREEGLSTALITVSRGDVFLEGSQFQSTNRSYARIRGDESVEGPVWESTDDFNVFDRTEATLEEKMEEIRGIINDKFGEKSVPGNDSDTDDTRNDEEVVIYTPPAELDYYVFGFSPTPSAGSANDVRNLSLNFIGKPYRIDGVALGFMNMTYEDVHGVQIGALSNQTGRDQYGVLSAGIYNIVNRDMWGVASAGIYNIVNRDMWGVASAGIFNLNYSRLMGIQTAGIFNISKSYAYGGQVAGIFNISNGMMYGVQAAGIFNIANGQANGLQTAGIFNVAGNINGSQIGLINIGGIVNGMQIGLININDDINGLPIGLITISKNGIMDFGGWYESSGFFYTGIQTGSKNFYNFAYLGFPVENQGSILVAGLGIGARINLTPLYIDLDASVKSVASGENFARTIENTFSPGNIKSVYPNVRISAGLKMFRVLSLYGGMSLDIHIPGVTTRSEYFHNYSDPWIWKDPDTGADMVEFHPKWYGGLKINL